METTFILNNVTDSFRTFQRSRLLPLARPIDGWYREINGSYGGSFVVCTNKAYGENAGLMVLGLAVRTAKT